MPTRLVEYLLIPPTSTLLLIVLGLLLILYWRKIGYCLIALGTGLLYLASVPAVSEPLLHSLQDHLEVLKTVPGDAQAIVLLGAGRHTGAEEYGGDTVNHYTLERARYAARLHRKTGLPILASGGIGYTGAKSGADLARQVLEREFDVPVRWLEERSGNTYQNARYSAELLHTQGVDHVLVVTHAWHMRRALWAFAQTDVQATPAPTAFSTPGPQGSGQEHAWVPRYQALAVTGIALHEWLGLLWYRWRYD